MPLDACPTDSKRAIAPLKRTLHDLLTPRGDTRVSGRPSSVRRRSWSWCRTPWKLIAAVGAIGVWTSPALALEGQHDSGWVVARPVPLIVDAEPADAAARIAIDHLLGQSRQPLLKKTTSSMQSIQVPGDPIAGTPRLAQQVPGIDGWRPAAPQRPTIDKPPITPVGPQLHVDSIASETSNETDTSGTEASTDESTSLDTPGEAAPLDAPTNETLEFRAPQVNTFPTIEFGQSHHPTEAPSVETDSTNSSWIEISSTEFGCDTCPDPDARFVADSTDDLRLPADDVTPESFSDASDDEDISAHDEDAREANELAPDDESGTEVTDIVGDQAAAPATTHKLTLPSDVSSSAVKSPPPSVTKPAPKPLPPLTRQLTNLRAKVRGVLKGYYRKPLNSRDNDPWEVMHGMLSYELHSRIHQNGPRGTLITSIGWLCYNKPCKGLTLMYVTPEGELRAKQGVGLQGHKGQLLAMLAQCRVSPEYPIRVGGHEFTIADLIEAEKKTCYPKTELTFKLIALTHYLDLNVTWLNDEGLDWSIPRLIREELAQPIRGAACGGTHRLSGLTLAVKARQRRLEPLDGEYLNASEYLEKYEQYAFRLQNRDGSLSTRWFQGAGDEDDIDRRLKTTGHILEWLVYTLTDEELRAQRTIRAVNYLATLLYENYDHEWEVGSRSHAIHALVRYDERVFKPFDGVQNVARKGGSNANHRESKARQVYSNRR